MASSPIVEESPVLHVVVVGFHHKKGCQVEYSYPPLIPGGAVDSHDTPDEWRHLPSLALPDGAHNYIKDTIYFHLPARDGKQETIYGVSCYRQMDAKDLKNKTADVTRSTVQKSVCVLSKLPLYGLIQAKLELITHAYFDERDFTKVELLEQTYSHLNLTLTEGLLDESRIYLGLSPRDLVWLFKHKIVLLFKLILLEKRVLFSGAPVQKLCGILLSVVSLFPGMLEHGLQESASYCLQRQLSPTLKLAHFGIDMNDYLEISYKDVPNHKHSKLKTKDEDVVKEQTDSRNRIEECTKGDKPCDTPCDNTDSDTNAESCRADPLGVLPYINSVNKHGKNVENRQLKDTSVKNIPEKTNGGSQSLKNITFVTPERQKSSSAEKGDKQKVIQYSSIPDPLANTGNITHVEAVQSNSHCQADALFSDDSPARTPEHEKTPPSLIVNMSDEEKQSTSRSGRHVSDSSLIRDIDSPESISEIDKEDCFSWEEDRLLLEIDQELQDGSTPSHENLNPGMTSNQQKQPTIQTMDRTDSASNETDVLTETSDEDTSFRIVSKVNSSDDKKTLESNQSSPRRSARTIRNKLSSAFQRSGKDKLALNQDDEKPSELTRSLTSLHQDEYGFPLAVFTKGCLCHPYLCLQYYDLLQDVNVKSFMIGATNVLFKQKRHLTDVIVDVNDGKIDISDVELRKQLQMTTADLRFADILVKAVTEEENKFLEGTEWEGGDQWLRAQFRSYLLGLLAASTVSDDQLLDDFGQVYVNTWKMTHNYRVWHSCPHPGINQAQPGHPCQGNLSVNDIRVRFTSAMQNSDRGRKINSAMAQTGKYVAQTGRAVGGAFNQAKSTVSSWISNWRS
ncbi:late secretory pathway protein AVL9 homolog [Liolophura sinensis]|uniref:late secretory pathway protein AVL9 homolog n=1 Tax=Liolophura sinensis TaxID=3198878 RepID=UPI0031585AF6